MPNLQDDDLALLRRQSGQPPHGFGLGPVVIRAGFEPAHRLPFPCQTTPETAAIIEGPIAEGPQTIMFRIVRSPLQLEQGQKGFLHHIFSFAVAQAKGAPIKNQPRRFGFIKRLAPRAVALRGVHIMSLVTPSGPLMQLLDNSSGEFV